MARRPGRRAAGRRPQPGRRRRRRAAPAARARPDAAQGRERRRHGRRHGGRAGAARGQGPRGPHRRAGLHQRAVHHAARRPGAGQRAARADRDERQAQRAHPARRHPRRRQGRRAFQPRPRHAQGVVRRLLHQHGPLGRGQRPDVAGARAPGRAHEPHPRAARKRGFGHHLPGHPAGRGAAVAGRHAGLRGAAVRKAVHGHGRRAAAAHALRHAAGAGLQAAWPAAGHWRGADRLAGLALAALARRPCLVAKPGLALASVGKFAL